MEIKIHCKAPQKAWFPGVWMSLVTTRYLFWVTTCPTCNLVTNSLVKSHERKIYCLLYIEIRVVPSYANKTSLHPDVYGKLPENLPGATQKTTLSVTDRFPECPRSVSENIGQSSGQLYEIAYGIHLGTHRDPLGNRPEASSSGFRDYWDSLPSISKK